MNEKEQKAEGLFLRRLDELELLTNSTDPFEVLDIVRPLRQLLLDERPLIHEVNRKYQLEIRFRIAISKMPSLIKAMGVPESALARFYLQDGLDPDTASPGKAINDVDLEGFLKTIVFLKKGRKYSIREIITYEGNVDGGVHLGVPKTQPHKEFAHDDETVLIGGDDPLVRQLKSIGTVVIKSLNPLRAEIEATRRRP